MSQEIVLKRLSEETVSDYEILTKHGDDGKLCYCSFWHQKWASMDEYHRMQRENPERLRNCVLERMKAQFHVGLIAYLLSTELKEIQKTLLFDRHATG